MTIGMMSLEKGGKNMPTKTLQSGTIVKIEGKEYIVLEQKENDKYLVMTAKNVNEKVFQDHCTYRAKIETQLRPDGQHSNLYEGSRIDKYLERFWYNELPRIYCYAIFAGFLVHSGS